MKLTIEQHNFPVKFYCILINEFFDPVEELSKHLFHVDPVAVDDDGAMATGHLHEQFVQ